MTPQTMATRSRRGDSPGASGDEGTEPMQVGILIYHHVNELEAVAPLAVLAAGQRLLGGDGEAPEIEVSTLARSRFSVQTSGGLTVTPAWAFASAPAFDALVVPGGPGADRALRDGALLSYFETRVPQIGRLISISAGALILGTCGLLRNQRVAAHAAVHQRLEAFEVAGVSAGGIVRNERIWSAASANDAAGVALALLAERFGDGAAATVEAFLSGRDAEQA